MFVDYRLVDLLGQVTVGFFPERNGNARKIRSCVSEKRSIGFYAFCTFFIGSWLSFWWPNFFRIYMQGFPGIFCYILGVKVTDLVSLMCFTYDVTTHWNRLGETISMRVLSYGLVEKWESYHENRFVHSFLTVALLPHIKISKIAWFWMTYDTWIYI